MFSSRHTWLIDWARFSVTPNTLYRSYRGRGRHTWVMGSGLSSGTSILLEESRSSVTVFLVLEGGQPPYHAETNKEKSKERRCQDKKTIRRKWIEQGISSHQTHYRSYRGRVFTSQMTQPTVSKHWREIGPKDYTSIPSGPPHRAQNNTTHMQYETKTHKIHADKHK